MRLGKRAKLSLPPFPCLLLVCYAFLGSNRAPVSVLIFKAQLWLLDNAIRSKPCDEMECWPLVTCPLCSPLKKRASIHSYDTSWLTRARLGWASLSSSLSNFSTTQASPHSSTPFLAFSYATPSLSSHHHLLLFLHASSLSCILPACFDSWCVAFQVVRVVVTDLRLPLSKKKTSNTARKRHLSGLL